MTLPQIIEDKQKAPSYEVYTIILKHSIFDGEREIQMEEPLVIKHMTLLGFGHSEYIINDMMERMKCELLKRCVR